MKLRQAAGAAKVYAATLMGMAQLSRAKRTGRVQGAGRVMVDDGERLRPGT
jgi:hypothetical protein